MSRSASQTSNEDARSATEQPLIESTVTAIDALRGRDPELARVVRRLAKVLTATSVVSAAIGGIEAAIEHYRGSYNQWVMWTPVGASAALMATSIAALRNDEAFRKWMPAASVLMIADGLAGVFYHIRGIHRRPGGFREPVFNITAGAPLFAPLILSGAGAVGLLALLLEKSADAATRSRRPNQRHESSSIHPQTPHTEPVRQHGLLP